ncbi:pterin-4a-carbinolamine dehydratase [Pedobacter sp. UYP30]
MWKNEWNKVEIWLSRHDKGNVATDKDTALATAADGSIRIMVIPAMKIISPLMLL